jgi:DNA-directed RNA polymerase subunit RPC12/RpoP
MSAGDTRRRSVRRKGVIAGVCVVVVACCGFLLTRHSDPYASINLADYHRPWVCEACGHTFRELPGPGTRRCPKCGQDKCVQSVVFVCGRCGREFEAYRRLDQYDTGATFGQDGKLVLPLPHFRRAGGEWTTDQAALGPAVCPCCGNGEPATLKEKAFGPGGK